MKIWKGIFILLALPFLLNGLEYVPNQIIFKTSVPKEITQNRIGLDEFDDFLTERHVNNIKPILRKSQNKYYVASFNEDIDWNNIKNLQFEGIEYFQLNYINTLYVTPNDPEYINQLIDFENCQIPQAWSYTTGNQEIIVALVDSGVLFDHPDLQNNILINEDEIPDDAIDNDNNGYIDDWRGWDFVDAPELYSIALGDYTEQDNDPTDELNHGTHIAGIIGADANNNEGVCGICWSVKVLVIRSGFNTIGGFGYLQDDDAAAGIIYAADMGADIISLSWGDLNFSQIIADACYYAYEHGSIIVASAGNEGSTSAHLITYPARLSTTISAGAIDSNKQLTSFSSYGPELDLVAPGLSIISTYDTSSGNLYKEQSGTSMSAPFIAGIIALLLSVEPGLNYEQVRGRLISSAIDLGEPGFDNVYGNGLVDAYSLLINLTYPEIGITDPPDNAGLSESFDIIGTALAPNFWRYSVKYTSAEMPAPLDWDDVDPDILYYYNEVDDDILAHFEISEYFTDGTYQIKVEVSTTTNESFDYRRTIHIDQTPPVFKEEYAAYMKRYNDEISEYFIQAVYDEKVYIDHVSFPETPYNSSSMADSIHILKIINPYCYSPIDILARNLAGLETRVDSAYYFQQDYTSVNVHGYEQMILGNELAAIRKTYDFDGNGKSEFVALEMEGEIQTLKIFEISNNELITKYDDFPQPFWPYDIGNTNEEGMEILGLMSDMAVVYETPLGSSYPENYLGPIEDAFGGNFADYDGDGIDEIILIKNVDINTFSFRALVLYNRSGNDFTDVHTIINETPTSIKNVFVNKVCCGKLDNDSHPDILAADTDGDVMIFEKESPEPESEFEMVWHYRLPVSNAHYLAIGDFTGDGNNEFCVGGYTYNEIDPAKTFSYFEFFKNTGENNEYASMGYVSFTHVEMKNSIATADLDGDGDEEIILSVPPNTYIIDYIDGEFIPIWRGVSAKTSQSVIAASSKTENEDAFIIINTQDVNEIKSSLIIKEEDFNGPLTPSYFRVSPSDSTSVWLTWYYEGNTYYNVYRKQNENISLIASLIFDDDYFDTGLVPCDTLYYQVTAVDSSYIPCESLPTSWKIAIPYYSPELEYIKMISPYEVKVKFNRELHYTATNRAFYDVHPDAGHPSSVNLLEQNTSVILRFPQKFEEIDEYSLDTSYLLTGITGVPVIGSPFIFQYEPDTTPPEILTIKNQDLQTVNLFFTEAVNSEMAEDISNYTLVLPAIDRNNEIESLEYNDAFPDSFYVSIQMKKKLEYTNQPYFLKIDNLEDLAGNRISNSGNKCHFSLTGMSGLKNLKQMRVYPNPLDMSKSGFDAVNFINLPIETSGSIWIYDLSGELIFKKKVGPYYNPIEFFCWECRNNAGKKVSSGIYFYIIKMGKDSKKGKIVIIN
ncbi:MAG: S8 family serine peptidase [Candidatus Cloacimonetes bacterium]|nr:S8 family serine peptidase [Candidatus Cloacimonadota bacterium]